jgi:DnaJ-class molecular chaperone
VRQEADQLKRKLRQLQKLDLPANATSSDIKKRFRQLAKQKHPDYGGNSAQFIELMEIYRKLIEGD